MSATTGVANLRPGRDGYLRAGVVCEVSNMEPVRATLEADLAVAPLLGHAIPESLEIISADRRLPRLPSDQSLRDPPCESGCARLRRPCPTKCCFE
jgi:hypothetical protein